MRTEMRLVWSLLSVTFLVSSVCSSAQTRSPLVAEFPCREHPQRIGRCFTIRGRMSYWNGNPAVRIWRVETKRILGVSDGRFKIDGYANLPQSIGAKLSWESDLVGDFSVCPFTRDEPGVMQLVCVDSAKDLTVRPHKHP
jgi:hypothetical protein